MIGTHSRYQEFIAYGDPENYEGELEKFRISLEKESS
jgi:hypothetical protein